MDEFDAVLKARELVRKVSPTAIPVSVELYAREVGAIIRPQTDLGADEPGWSFENNGKHYICTNANDRPERQRFTVCHELGHCVLGHPSEHGQSTWWSYAKKPLAEILCDVFAAELLLPSGLFKPEAEKVSISLSSIDNLAAGFEASVMATGSRYAAVVSTPLAFVLSEKGKIRYASRSTSLREAGAWIQPNLDLPRNTLSEKVRAGARSNGPSEVDADVWFKEWERGGTLLEEARHLSTWDQTLTLLWFEDEEVPPRASRYGRDDDDENDGLLKELDGNLRWPDKRRRS